MTACTDGYLEGQHIREIFAIVEEKATRRDPVTRPNVLWQEAAEMIAWILTDKNSRQCPLDQRLIISHDNDEIYLILATYPPEYLEYLQGRLSPSTKKATQAFLTIEEYRPWNISSATNMRQFALVIMTFCLRFTDEIKQVRASMRTPSTM